MLAVVSWPACIMMAPVTVAVSGLMSPFTT